VIQNNSMTGAQMKSQYIFSKLTYLGLSSGGPPLQQGPES